MKKVIVTLLLCLCCAVMAVAQSVQISAGYMYQATQTLGGGNQICFNGGRADVAFGLPRHFAMVGELTGTRSDMGSATYDMTLLTIMAGPRFQMPIKNSKGKPGRVSPFAQFLVGDARGSNGAFPKNGTLVPSAESLALSGGGGIDFAMAHHTTWRLLQVDYLNTQLPNLYATHQNYYRIGTSLVIHLR